MIAVFDRLKDRITLFAPVRPEPGVETQAAYRRACERLSDVVADLERSLPYRREPVEAETTPPEPASNMSREQFHEMVRRAKEYIFAGDIFQVVLSQRFALPFALPPLALYRALRRLNPSPFHHRHLFGL